LRACSERRQDRIRAAVLFFQEEGAMIDHIGFPIRDYERSKVFYAKALAPLGYALVMEIPGEANGSGFPAAGFGADGKPDFWIGGGGLSKPVHVAILAKDRGAVDAFHRGARSGREGQRRAGAAAALPRGLLRRLRARSRRPQHRSGLPRAGVNEDQVSANRMAACRLRHAAKKSLNRTNES
jgi:catechol 2,3-dioxygenase-like lactoylglutathione lyase family enzyme